MIEGEYYLNGQDGERFQEFQKFTFGELASLGSGVSMFQCFRSFNVSGFQKFTFGEHASLGSGVSMFQQYYIRSTPGSNPHFLPTDAVRQAQSPILHHTSHIRHPIPQSTIRNR